eukprot:3544498-Pleurochrysis_carterae.AAC.1
MRTAANSRLVWNGRQLVKHSGGSKAQQHQVENNLSAAIILRRHHTSRTNLNAPATARVL